MNLERRLAEGRGRSPLGLRQVNGSVRVRSGVWGGKRVSCSYM